MGRHSRKGPAPKSVPPKPGSGAAGAGRSGGGPGEPYPQAQQAYPQAQAHAQTQPYPQSQPHAQQQPQASPRPQAYPAGAAGTGRRGRPPAPGGPAAAEHRTPAQGAPPPMTRGGHPEQYEAGGGWGDAGSARPAPGGRRIPGPRGESAAAGHGSGAPARPADPYASVTDWTDEPPAGAGAEADAPAGPPPPGGAVPGQRTGGGKDPKDVKEPKGGKGRAFTGIAAAAVTTVLAVVVAGQVAEDADRSRGTTAAGPDRGEDDAASRSQKSRPAPSPAGQKDETAVAPTYAQLMAKRFPIDRNGKADGTFEVVPGHDRAPGGGNKVSYRVEVEKGLDMDGELFASAIQRTLNDDRSWAHKGAMTFERISSGEPRFIITLASPATTDVWCAKSGLNTSIDDVSCDSASTDRVMINAYRWGQGSESYGPAAMHAYRQMLINHEVGHRLGHGHVNCDTEGALAPVMQQQTKSLNIDGVECRPNPWPYPGS
ncbi:DUF3152 domain-containing protein [Streptomyces sp. NPDC014894]|uniref:DUF3152 domain-containing protein n=1 Tax=Streptomyces sp. NPDC014894 TaxID=3364931 RepID=UPI0036F71DDA